MKKCPKTKNCAKNIYQKKKQTRKLGKFGLQKQEFWRRNIFHLKNFKVKIFQEFTTKYNEIKITVAGPEPIFHISRDLTTVLTLEKKNSLLIRLQSQTFPAQ